MQLRRLLLRLIAFLELDWPLVPHIVRLLPPLPPLTASRSLMATPLKTLQVCVCLVGHLPATHPRNLAYCLLDPQVQGTHGTSDR